MNLLPQILNRSRIYLLYWYAALLPFSEWLPVRLNNILLILLCGIWVAEVLLKKTSIRHLRTPVFFLLSGIFFIQLVDFLHPGDLSLAGKNIFLKLPFLLFPLVLSHVSLLHLQQKRLYQFFTAGCFLACVVSFRFFLNEECADVNWLRVADYDEYLVLQRPYFGLYLILAICFLITLYQSKRQFFYLIAVLFFLCFLWIIQAKMALVILAVILMKELLSRALPAFKKIIALGLSAAAIIVVVLLTVFYLQHRKTPNKLAGNQRFFVLSINTRLEHFTCAAEIIRANPLFGTGISDLRHELTSCYDRKGTEFNKHGYYFNIHNEWLEETARHGILGLAVYMMAFFVFLRRSRLTKNHLYFQFLFIIIFSGMTETFFSRAQGVLLIAFFNTIFYYTRSQTEE